MAMTRFRDKKILVIDDDADIFYFYKLILEKAGYTEIRHADTGESGVSMAREWRPDLIVSDLLHPGQDGFGVFEELFLDLNTLSTRFMLITGCAPHLYPHYRKKALAAGVSRYLAKPIEPREFLYQVESVLEEAEEENKKGL